jgi:hypothetical protein
VLKVNYEVDNSSGDESSQSTDIIIDSGASHHMTRDLESLGRFRLSGDDADETPLGQIRTGTGTISKIEGYGDQEFIKNVLWVPELEANTIISVGLLTESGYTVIFTKSGVKVLN